MVARANAWHGCGASVVAGTPGNGFPGYKTAPVETGYRIDTAITALKPSVQKSLMPYHQLFYHLVWATKNREPLLAPQVEPIVYDLLRSKAIGLDATVFAIGGMEEHLHMVVSIPPVIAVSTFIGQVKGAASTCFNKGGHGSVLFWKGEYGAFTFDAKRLPNYIAYVQRQKEHHSQGTTIPLLERTSSQPSSLLIVSEEAAGYWAEDAGWRRELVEMDL